MTDLTHEAQLTLESIRADILLESANLTALYKEKDSLKVDRKVFEAEKSAYEAKKLSDETMNASERAEIARSREQMTEEAHWHEKAITELKTQNKLALKDLGWVNDKVLKAEDLIKDLNNEAILLLAKIEEEKLKLAQFISLEKQVEDLDFKRVSILTEIDLAKANADTYLKSLQAEVEQVLVKRDEAIEQTTQAEYNLKDYTSQLFIKREDFKVYVDRLEVYYKQAFPDLKIIL